MAISRELMNKMAQKLTIERLSQEFYNNIEGLLQDVLVDVSKKNNLPLNQLNFFIAGDHMLNTNILNSSPLVVFVSIKQNKEDVLLFRKSKNLSKKMQKFVTPALNVTDEFLATHLFYALQAQLDTSEKIFLSKNVIMLNLNNTIKIKIIVGYYFNQIFEYEYLGSLYEENLLNLIEAFDQKEKETSYFYTLVRILKSMELEVYDLGFIKQKTFDTFYFIENLVYNIPNELLSGSDIYDVFIKAINYLKNAKLNEFKLASKEQLMFTKESHYSVNKAKFFIKVIEKFFTHFEKIFA